jgi:hypothetical protein
MSGCGYTLHLNCKMLRCHKEAVSGKPHAIKAPGLRAPNGGVSNLYGQTSQKPCLARVGLVPIDPENSGELARAAAVRIRAPRQLRWRARPASGASQDGRPRPRRDGRSPRLISPLVPVTKARYRRVPCRGKRGLLRFDPAGSEPPTCTQKREKQRRRAHVELAAAPFSKPAWHGRRARSQRPSRSGLAKIRR